MTHASTAAAAIALVESARLLDVAGDVRGILVRSLSTTRFLIAGGADDREKERMARRVSLDLLRDSGRCALKLSVVAIAATLAGVSSSLSIRLLTDGTIVSSSLLPSFTALEVGLASALYAALRSVRRS